MALDITNIEFKQVEDKTVLQIECGTDIAQIDFEIQDDMLEQLKKELAKLEKAK